MPPPLSHSPPCSFSDSLLYVAGPGRCGAPFEEPGIYRGGLSDGSDGGSSCSSGGLAYTYIIYLSICLSIYLSLSIDPSIYLSIYLSIDLHTHIHAHKHTYPYT